MTTKDRYGAAPDDWDHFDVVLGLTEDLLPVVSNPNAEIAEYSKVKEPGKVPSEYNRKGKMHGMPGWAQKVTAPREIEAWKKVPDYGVCISTRNVRALDVDIADPEESAAVRAFLEARLSVKLPCRGRSNSSKFLFAFTMPGDYSKRRFDTRTPKNAIEMLATGQQFVAIGTHPSGVRYEWEGGLPNEIPELDPAEFEAIWSALFENFGSGEIAESKRGITPAKKRQLDDMNDPVVDFLDDRGWIKDISRDGRVDITCPFEDQHTSDSSDSSTSYFPAGVGGFERGHFQCLHSHCAGRTDSDFLHEIGWTTHGFEVIEIDEPVVIDQAGNKVPAPQTPDIFKNSKYLSKDGVLKPVRATVMAAVSYPPACGCLIGYDAFTDDILRSERDTMRGIRDDDYFDIALRLEQGDPPFSPIASELVRDAVRYVARRNGFDSWSDWLLNLPAWDGVVRVEHFLRDYLGAEDTPYARAVSRYFWTALAGRGVDPGIKADMVPIAVGKQGARKTTLISRIPPLRRMFVELDLSKSDDTLAREMRGTVVAELGEMKGLGHKQLEHTKSFISRTEEVWVPKYQEFATRYLRRCIFFGTTNDDEPLPDDDTGQRRWLPFKVGEGHKCGVEQLEVNRLQLFAEALVLYRSHGGIMWEDAERLAPAIHKDFEKEDSWAAKIERWVFNAEMGDTAPIDMEGGMRLLDVLENCLNMRAKEINRATELRVAKCLRQLGLKNSSRNGRKIWIRDVSKFH